MQKSLLTLFLIAVLVPSPFRAQPVVLKGSTTRLASFGDVRPESVGFSSERLERLHEAMQQRFDNHQVPGMVTLLARHGRIVDFQSYGRPDLSVDAPMDRESIFRIYSMTKPVTGVAMMILYEQGKWNPQDPIARHIPEFANLKVFKSMGAGGHPVLEAPAHPPTMAELMSHNAGFTYGLFGDGTVDKMYRDAAVLNSAILQEMIGKLSRLPLLYQPGSRWVYSVSVDIQGYLVEKLSGKPLGEFLRDQIFLPLGMHDTGFHVESDKLSRLAPLYSMTPQGKLSATTGGSYAVDYSREPSMPSGGGGLLSTARDYFRFCQMLLNHGELDGVRILAPSSVAMMGANRLPSAVTESGQYGIGRFKISPGFGFGFDFGIFTDPAALSRAYGKGTMTWGGIAGTWFWIDPANDVIFVGMVQRLLDATSPDLATISQQAVYQALVNPEK